MKYTVKHFDSTQFFNLGEQVKDIAQTAYVPAHLDTVPEIKKYMRRNHKIGRTVFIFHAAIKESPENIAESFIIGINN
jgi:hypothetical protein